MTGIFLPYKILQGNIFAIFFSYRNRCTDIIYCTSVWNFYCDLCFYLTFWPLRVLLVARIVLKLAFCPQFWEFYYTRDEIDNSHPHVKFYSAKLSFRETRLTSHQSEILHSLLFNSMTIVWLQRLVLG